MPDEFQGGCEGCLHEAKSRQDQPCCACIRNDNLQDHFIASTPFHRVGDKLEKLVDDADKDLKDQGLDVPSKNRRHLASWGLKPKKRS